MSVNYPDSEWEIIDGVRYRKTSISPKSSKKVKVKDESEKAQSYSVTFEGSENEG